MGRKVNLALKGFKTYLIKFLRGEFVKLALKKLLGSAVMGGFKGWAVKYVATHLYDEIAVPLIKYLFRKGMFYYDKRKGKIMYKRLVSSKDENDENSYNDITDNA